jgi:hypothetical protein
VESVLSRGYWVRRNADLPADEGYGVLVLKPGIRATAAFVRELGERAGECGYGVVEARIVDPSEIRETGIARRHYHAHSVFAERGQLTPSERVALLGVYDTPAFSARFGQRARDLPVMPVELFIERSRTPREVIRRWSDASTALHGLNSGVVDGPNEVSDDKYVNLFADPQWTPDGPVFLINSHMPSVLGWWEESITPRLALLLVRMSTHAFSWDRLRAEFCGASDCARALPGSLRRDALDGVLDVPLEPGQKVDRTRNVVHLSNGPVEAMRETALWFDRPIDEQRAGHRFLALAGIGAGDLDRAYLEVEGSIRPLTSATSGLSLAEAAALIRRGRLLDVEAPGCTIETARRIDVAHTLLPAILAEGPVTAVLMSGSSARNRASRDSDVDLVVVANGTAARTERRSVDGMMFECEWMNEDRARHVAEGGDRRDLKGLREASRLAAAIPLHDPGRLVQELRSTANSLSPASEELDERLVAANLSLRTLVTDQELPDFVQWETLREIQDQLAVSLLSLHALRYQKPKWVIHDLHDIGRGELAAALLRSYGSTDDADDSAQTMTDVEAMLTSIAKDLDLPIVSAVLTHGFVEEFPGWSYACRTFADAASLLEEGHGAAADYTAKFAVRLALRLELEITSERAYVIAAPPEAQNARGTESHSDRDIERAWAYRQLFPTALVVHPPSEDDLQRCADWLQLTMEARARAYGL